MSQFEFDCKFLYEHVIIARVAGKYNEIETLKQIDNTSFSEAVKTEVKRRLEENEH